MCVCEGLFVRVCVCVCHLFDVGKHVDTNDDNVSLSLKMSSSACTSEATHTLLSSPFIAVFQK